MRCRRHSRRPSPGVPPPSYRHRRTRTCLSVSSRAAGCEPVIVERVEQLESVIVDCMYLNDVHVHVYVPVHTCMGLCSHGE